MQRVKIQNGEDLNRHRQSTHFKQPFIENLRETLSLQRREG
jgi:hypothetical protein